MIQLDGKELYTGNEFCKIIDTLFSFVGTGYFGYLYDDNGNTVICETDELVDTLDVKAGFWNDQFQFVFWYNE
jgi:hypothetical protein